VLAAASQQQLAMADELERLANAIKENEEELKEVRAAIKTIRTGDNAAVEALGYGSRDEAKTALPRLETKEADLRKLLILDKEKEARLQQPSSAGTSMLPVHQEVVMSAGQRSCCIHQRTS
jgi:hypothetical protein